MHPGDGDISHLSSPQRGSYCVCVYEDLSWHCSQHGLNIGNQVYQLVCNSDVFVSYVIKKTLFRKQHLTTLYFLILSIFCTQERGKLEQSRVCLQHSVPYPVHVLSPGTRLMKATPSLSLPHCVP